MVKDDALCLPPKEVYQGEWANDERHGYGVCEYADGSKFRGEWEEGCWLQSTADPTFTRVHGSGLSRGIVGEPTTFCIEARDELKNKRMNGGDDFYVRFENDATGKVAFATVSDADDGTYTVKFITTAAGNYTCSVLIGADEHVADSPYPVRILPVDHPLAGVESQGKDIARQPLELRRSSLSTPSTDTETLLKVRSAHISRSK